MSLLFPILTAILHIAVPLALAAWVGVKVPDSRLYLLAKLLLVVSYIGVLWTAGAGWHIFGTAFRPLIGLATLAAVVSSFRWWPELPWWSGDLWPTGVLFGLWLLLGGFFAAGLYTLVDGLQPPDVETVDMQLPLADGDYYVVWGGSSPAANRHVKILDKNLDYRGQAYAYDLVELNWLGARASGLAPTDPAAYRIFGAELHAPCAGEVLRAVGDREDVDPPTPDDGPPAGNHVLLQCGDVQVLLAHLQQGSLEVDEGDTVEVGDPLGLVGNSGNTTEPHLHIHAQRPPEDGPWMSGDPLAITFDGEFTPKGTTISR